MSKKIQELQRVDFDTAKLMKTAGYACPCCKYFALDLLCVDRISEHYLPEAYNYNEVISGSFEYLLTPDHCGGYHVATGGEGNIYLGGSGDKKGVCLQNKN